MYKKILFYLDNMDQAQDISYKGMKFVEKNHMSINRVSEILEKIQITEKKTHYCLDKKNN